MRSCKRILCEWILQLFVVSFLVSTATGQAKTQFRVGGLFEKNDKQQELAFRRAISMINTDNSILFNVELVADTQEVAPQDSFRALKKSCDFMRKGIVALISPESPSNAAVLHSLCDHVEVPLLQTFWVPRSAPRSHVINLFPDSKLLASAFVDFLREQNWKSFTLIYEENEDLIRLQNLLQFPTAFKDSHIKITLRQAKDSLDLSKLMKDLKKLGETNIVMDLPLHRMKELFAAAEKVDMMTEYNNYLLTSLDVHTVEWTESYVGRSNITAFRLINPDNEIFKRFLKDWIFAEQTIGNDVVGKQPITTEAALMYDAVLMLASAIEGLKNSEIKKFDAYSLDCDSNDKWLIGNGMANHMKLKHYEGASGLVKINKDGVRDSFSLDLVKITKRGIIKVATWDTENRISIEKETIQVNEDVERLRNTTLRVTTILSNPYMMNRNDPLASGNDRFEGFCKDLLDKLAEIWGFKYIITPVKDKSHGSFKNGKWNGMIGELLRREADLAIGDLSITFQREGAVDFTMPFMNLGISILFKKPEKQTPPMFSFLKPLSLEVWFYMGTAYLGVSLFLFILARLSPYEWVNPHPCEVDNDVVENQFTLLNSFWFTIGSIMQQGSDILPRAISTRIVASSWWFFTLIMISSYTANLAAFLTAQRMSSPIESADDLAKQTTILYGSVFGGSTMNFFKESNYPVYKRMWGFMESQRPSVFPETNDRGIERVKMGNYAFLMESTTIEYVTERNCELTKIGDKLDSKGYGIATPPGSPYRKFLSSGILNLQEKQQLQILKDKWWKAPERCPDDSGSSSAEMGIRNVGGVFLVLGIGSLLGIVIVILEFVWKANKMLERGSIASMLWQELRSTLSCRGSTRPAPKDPDEPSVEKMPMVNLAKMEDYKFS